MSDSGSLKRLWLAQFLSLFGTDVTKFALRVWTYASTGSSTQFALVTFFSEMPSILLSPFTGSLVDSVPRKQLMIMADAVAAAATFILFLLHSAGLLSVSHIYLANIVGSVCNSIQWPAFISTVSMMVEKKDLVKVNGWNQAANGMSMLLAPLLAGYLVNDLTPAGLRTVFFIEFLTFALACVITLGTAIPSASAETDEKAKEPSRPGSFISYLWQQTLSAWSFISARPGLLALLFLLSQTMFLSGMVQVLMTPLVLGFSTPLMLGNVLTFSGIGAMLGFALPALWGGPKVRKTWGVLGCVGVQGVLLAGVGLYRSVPWVLFIAVSYMAMVPLNRALRESIWQSKTPPAMQGRVFALQQSIQKLSLPIAAIAAGPLCDAIFEPAMQSGGSLSGSFGGWLGTGKGRGAALMLMIGGLANVASVLFMSLRPELRDLDVLLPDWESEREKEVSSKEG